ncbi:MAG: hypothetical protein KF862_03885 [Chitinophagaceae bacterium]|nr:hypothetical protein [Chitinophagaceae bacterium]
MIHLKRYFIIIMALAAFCNCKKNKGECCIQIDKPSGTYIYPVAFGNPDWSLYQIPDSILINMSTPALIQSLLDNPNIPLRNIYSNVFQGRDQVLKRLNASTELNKRPDACQKLYERYIQMTPCCFPENSPSVERGNYIEGWVVYEEILTQDSILNQFDHSKKIDLARVVVKKQEIKMTYGESFGTSKVSGVLVLSQIMKLDNYRPFMNELNTNSDLAFYTTTGLATEANHEPFRNIILSYAKVFTK